MRSEEIMLYQKAAEVFMPHVEPNWHDRFSYCASHRFVPNPVPCADTDLSDRGLDDWAYYAETSVTNCMDHERFRRFCEKLDIVSILKETGWNVKEGNALIEKRSKSLLP
ncbi:MAG: hypothetical protein M1324_02145 [Patescibacteria group bacterium]|nr:hypothetical protein [Patescibacteria group bacterium]